MQGYIQIKKNPHHYLDADKDLTAAHQAIKGTEQALLEKLQHLNQAALQDFHISQRLSPKDETAIPVAGKLKTKQELAVELRFDQPVDKGRKSMGISTWVKYRRPSMGKLFAKLKLIMSAFARPSPYKFREKLQSKTTSSILSTSMKQPRIAGEMALPRCRFNEDASLGTIFAGSFVEKQCRRW